jgi:hypothetical protein
MRATDPVGAVVKRPVNRHRSLLATLVMILSYINLTVSYLQCALFGGIRAAGRRAFEVTVSMCVLLLS